MQPYGTGHIVRNPGEKVSRLNVVIRRHMTTGGMETVQLILLFDGAEISSARNVQFLLETFSFDIFEGALRKSLSDLRIRDLANSVDRITIFPSMAHNVNLGYIAVVDKFEIFRVVRGGDLIFRSFVDFEWRNWNKPWSPADVIAQMQEIAPDFPEIEGAYHGSQDSHEYQAIVEFKFRDWEHLLIDELNENWQTTKRFVQAVEQRLQSKLSENSLLSYFNFHPAVQGACEEYLWSFVQFLKDVGVEATAELKQDQTDPSKVLFSVTPTRGQAVLGKIKQALDLYINLAGASQFELDANSSIQTERLESRILFFQSQLKSALAEARLQQAEIRAHEATIQAKESTIYTQGIALERVNATNVFLLARVDEMVAEKAKKAKDEREFFGGIFRLGNWNTKGVIINLPRLMDLVKVVFIESDEVSAHSTTQNELPPASRMPALPPVDENEG